MNKFAEEVYEFNLKKEEELRIEIGKEESAKITLESGVAEIEGVEIPLNNPIEFSYQKLKIFCWSDSKIKVQGNIQEPYASVRNKESMTEYILAHYLLNEYRNEALIQNAIGPKVLVTGSNFSGKSTFCHILLNYSLKLGWTPLYVDLDLSNEICFPGTISATVVDYLIPNDFMIDSAIVLFHGSTINDINYYLYESQVNEVASIVKGKLGSDLNDFKKKMSIPSEMDPNIFVSSEHPTLFASGAIIHCPLIDPTSRDRNIYKTIINDFDIDIVFVIENEKLNNDIKNYVERSGKNVIVKLLSKSTGINPDNSYKEYIEQRRFDSYFKGPFHNFKITELKIDLNKYKLIQINTSNVSSNILPIGQSSDLNLILKDININEDNLLSRIIAILYFEEKVINELDSNLDRRLNDYVDLFARSPVSFFGFMYSFF